MDIFSFFLCVAWCKLCKDFAQTTWFINRTGFELGLKLGSFSRNFSSLPETEINIYFSCRQRVMMQIVQELCKRPNLNRTGFDMPTIYIPNPNKTVRCVNQIDDVCRDIEKTINQTIQVIFFTWNCPPMCSRNRQLV